MVVSQARIESWNPGLSPRTGFALAALGPDSALADQVETWLLPVTALLVPLICSSALNDGFEIPKLAVVKVGLAAAMLVVAARGHADGGVLRTPAAIAALLFVGVASVATFASVEPRTSLLGSYTAQRGLLTLVVEVSWFLLAASWVRTEAALARIAWGFTVAGVLVGVYALVQVAGFDPLGFPKPVDDSRPSASFGYPNSLGEFLALSLPLTAWLAWCGVGLRRDLSFWALLPQVAGVVIAQTRTVWIAVLLEMLLVFPLVLCARWRRLRGLGIGLAVFPLVAIVAAFGVVVLVPAGASPVLANSDGMLYACPEAFCRFRGLPIQTRLALWSSATAMVAARPVLGSGPDTFGLVYPGYRSVELDTLDHAVGRDDIAHNVLLDTAVSSGLIGLAAAAAVHVAVLLVLLRALFGGSEQGGRRGIALALLLGWITFVVLFITGRMRLVTDWQAWVYAGLALGLFAPRPNWTWCLAPAARLAIVGVALILVADAATTVAADNAAHASSGVSSPAALDMRERAVTLRPFEPTYQRALGLALGAAAAEADDPNLHAAAVRHLTAASAFSGNRDPRLLVELGRAVAGWEDITGQPSDVPLGYAEQAIRIDRASPLPYADAAELALMRQRPDLGSAYWEAARIRTRTPDALRRLGEVAVELGDADSARIAFREATARETRSVDKGLAAREWAEAAFAEGLPDEAARAYAEVLQLTPNDATAQSRRVEALIAAGQRPQALAELHLARQAAPSDPLLADLETSLLAPTP